MNDKHIGPHCAGSCEGAAYQIELQKLRAERDDLDDAHTALEEAAGQLRAENEVLRDALEAAIEWDSYDDEGVPAVWLNQARQALAAHDKEVTSDGQ